MLRVVALALLLFCGAAHAQDGVANPQTDAGKLTTGILTTARGGTGAINGAIHLAAFANNVNFNAVADTTLTMSLPAGVTKYRINVIAIVNEGTTASLTTAAFGLFSAAAGGGTALIGSGTALSSITATGVNNTGNTFVSAVSNTYNFATLFFRITTAQGAAASGSIYVYVYPMP